MRAYSFFFPAAFALAHLALAAAAIFARPAALIFRRFFGAALPPLIFAHRALWAAAIAALAALERLYTPRPLRGAGALPPAIAPSSASNCSISSLMEIAFRSRSTVKLCNVVMPGRLPAVLTFRQENSP
jgi:hypothetical protein